MKSRFKKLFIVCLALFLFFPVLASAVELPNPLIHESFESLLDAIITFLAFYLGPPIAVIMILVAGFYFVTAAGDLEKVKKAKEIIKWTLIGLLILFCAKGIVALLKDVISLNPPA